MCSCGHLDYAYHLFLVCKKYSLARQSLMSNLLSLNYLYMYIIDVHLLLWGDESLTVDQNIKIFKAGAKIQVHTLRRQRVKPSNGDPFWLRFSI